MFNKYIDKTTFEIVDNVFEVDEDIALAISILNKKGYYTKFCCSGHAKDPRLYELYNVNNDDNFEFKSLGYIVNQSDVSYDIVMPFMYTMVYIMFDVDYNFDKLPEGFNKIDDNNVSDYVISKKIYYYNDGKRKSWNDIDKEIKEANDKLLEWVVSLSDNN